MIENMSLSGSKGAEALGKEIKSESNSNITRDKPKTFY